MTKKSAQSIYLGELKYVSHLLAKQKSWRDHDYKNIFRSVALLSFSFTTVLDDYIRRKAEYGCVVRDKVYQREATKRGYKDNSMTETDMLLAANMLVHKKKPEHFNDIESNCYKRVRLLGEARANIWDVERNILNAFPYDPDSADRFDKKNKRIVYIKSAEDDTFVQEVAAFNPLKRPAKLRYLEGVTEYTHAIHTILTAYHNGQPQRYTA